MNAKCRRRPWKAVMAAFAAWILLTGCGGTDNSTAPETVATTPPAQIRSRAWTCGEPSSQAKAALRLRVGAAKRALLDEPWALVRRGDVNFMAARLDTPDVNAPLIVLVSFPAKGDYLAGMKAINGTARTFTDLPHGGNTLPRGAEQALLCMAE